APSALAVMGLQFGYLLAGSILVETVFNWPGSGGLMNLAIFRRDVPVLSATILVLAAIFVAINILVDVLQALIDPRMRRYAGEPTDVAARHLRHRAGRRGIAARAGGQELLGAGARAAAGRSRHRDGHGSARVHRSNGPRGAAGCNPRSICQLRFCAPE